MSGDHHDVRTQHTASATPSGSAPQSLPLLRLDIHRMLDAMEWQETRAEFRYDPLSPLVVTVTFLIEGGPRATWRIGRDLLYQGLHSMSGVGDIQVWPSHLEERATAWLQLMSKDVGALFELPVPPLAEWLDDTYRLVPAGTETSRLDLDTFLADLLDGPEVPSD
nr:SsgA family sporulation/cell division regulator [Streptomyces sp. Xyl84]